MDGTGCLYEGRPPCARGAGNTELSTSIPCAAIISNAHLLSSVMEKPGALKYFTFVRLNLPMFLPNVPDL